MNTQHLHWEADLRFTGTDSYGRTVALDADLAATSGAKPSDLLPISLAACTAYDIVNILRKQRQGITGLDAEIISTQDDQSPWAFRRIELCFVARGDVDPDKARKALALSEKVCSVAATLRASVEIVASIEVTSP